MTRWKSLSHYPSGRIIPKNIRDRYKEYLQKHLYEEHPKAKALKIKLK